MSKTIPCKLAARKSSLGTQYVSLGAIILNFDLVGIGKKKKTTLEILHRFPDSQKNSDF